MWLSQGLANLSGMETNPCTPNPLPAGDLKTLELLAQTPGASWLRGIARSCGGIAALASMNVDPVPAGAFDWSSVDPADRPVVEAVLAAAEQVVGQRLDDEYLGIIRRLVAAAASHPAAPLRRRCAPPRFAAALVWLMLRGNERVGRGHRLIAGEDVWFWFGENSCADIGRKIAAAMGFVPDPSDPHAGDQFHDSIALGDVGLLHSRTRRVLLTRRNDAIYVAERIEASSEAARLVRQRPDGNFRITADETGVVAAVKAIAVSGQAHVTLIFGSSIEDPTHAIALTIPDARTLVAKMQAALDAPMPSQLR